MSSKCMTCHQVKICDGCLLQSERQARLSAETKLRELQDILLAFDNCEILSDELNEAWAQAIQESRIRNSES